MKAVKGFYGRCFQLQVPWNFTLLSDSFVLMAVNCIGLSILYN